MIYVKPKKYIVILGLGQCAPGSASAAATASEVPWQYHQCHSHWVPEFEKILQQVWAWEWEARMWVGIAGMKGEARKPPRNIGCLSPFRLLQQNTVTWGLHDRNVFLIVLAGLVPGMGFPPGL